MLTAQMVRDILAFTKDGMSIEALVEKIRARLPEISHNQVMESVLELNQKGLVNYSYEVGTWRATVRLV